MSRLWSRAMTASPRAAGTASRAERNIKREHPRLRGGPQLHKPGAAYLLHRGRWTVFTNFPRLA